MPTPIEQEIKRRACSRMVDLFETLGGMSGDMAARDDFGEFVRTIYIDLSKNLGYPAESPVGPVPKFETADVLNGSAASSVQPQKEEPNPQDMKLKIEMASPAQVEGIKKWTSPWCKRVVDDYLMAHKLRELKQLTKTQAMELMDELGKGAKK